MLNYIWAALIVVALVFAIKHDAGDIRHDIYRNGKALPITLKFAKPYDPAIKEQPVDVLIDPARYQSFYGVQGKLDPAYTGFITQTDNPDHPEVRFAKGVDLPAPLLTIRDWMNQDDAELRGALSNFSLNTDASTATAGVTFKPVQFVKVNSLTSAAVTQAKNGVTLSFTLIGTLALWCGLVRIAEKAGLLYAVVRITGPFLRLLFPEVPKDHPALAMIALNLTANILGLGNAATPLGLKAMEELQKLNPKKDTATNPMCMLLALHATAFQLTPSPALFAIMGLSAVGVYFPILIVTFLAMVIAAIAARVLSYLPIYRKTDPELSE
jgi:spore maturation protein A